MEIVMEEWMFKLPAALAPAVVLLIMMIRRDKARPEPRKWLLAAVGLGVFAAICVVLLGMVGIIPGVEVDSFWTAFYCAFASAAIPEEAVKMCMLALIASRCKHFDEFFDGIVYAVCIGMGFAALENILYVFGEDNWLVVSASRALLAVPAHYFFAVIMGSFYALAFFDRSRRGHYLAFAFLMPVVAHGLYDTLCFSMDISTTFSTVVLVAFFVCFKWIRKYSQKLMQNALDLDSYGLPTRE